ncbi:metalloregulator ArsR/SmtB family transcription factor [Catenulispora subtropica]|uniref:Metalloregulator ArsR/SmtB family transcription factor n=1 Tax=Catenulispora subtropica TaxID=450798 RepID=A0ABP5CJC1_9ACTN
MIDSPTAEPCCEPLAEHSISTADAIALAPAFKALGDPIRLQLLSQIASAPEGESCVCDLECGFEVSGPTISHHLKVLREAGLITGERRGTWVYYSAVREKMAALAALLITESSTATA